MDGTGALGAIQRRGRQGDGAMRGVTGLARDGLGVVAAEERRRYLRAALPTADRWAWVAPVFPQPS